MTGPAALRLAGVRKSFGAVAALKGVDLEVHAGEVHALLGENGAGKSTLMAIAAGALTPDAGTVEIGGTPLSTATPRAAQALGLTVVYQHPAVVEDLTVVENLVLAMPPSRRPSPRRARAWAADVLAVVEAEVDLDARGGELPPAQRQLVEIAKALATDPRVLVLDEPTAALSAAEVDRLFTRVRAIRDRGTAIVYISHRIPEVTAIADRLTVLRDGEQRGTFAVEGVSEDEIVSLILGREFAAAFPAKAEPGARSTLLEVRGLSGGRFDDVSFEVRAGEVLGLAGAEGNGQREVLRALAGLEPSDGAVRLVGEPVDLSSAVHAQRAGLYLVPGDRQREGLLTALSVRENAAVSSLAADARGGFVSRRRENERVGAALAAVDVRAASPELDVGALSGGNQQKVVLARALLADPRILLCEEPTQGVDAGARVEIYRLLRELAAEGRAVVVLSSDAVELEGLCDRVAIFSRGHVIALLEDGDVTEEQITGTAIRSTQARKGAEAAVAASAGERGAALRALLRSDRAAIPILLAAVGLLGLWTAGSDDSFLGAVNLESLLLLAGVLALVSFGQLAVLLTAGIDLSVGPLMALTVVVLSFHLEEGAGAGGTAVGLALVVVIGVGVGLANGLLVRAARISPIIATLATFIVLQGVAQLLRPEPDGVIAVAYADAVQASIGWVPLAFVAAVLLAFAGERVLRRRTPGLAVRAAGSDAVAAHRVGVPVARTVVGAYVLCSLFAVLAGIVLAGQVGVGDASVGTTYTLSSVTAVVLAGTSIYGGRGSFVATLLGALLVTEIINATSFLGMEQAWQYWLPGGLILIAAALFARTRSAGPEAQVA